MNTVVVLISKIDYHKVAELQNDFTDNIISPIYKLGLFKSFHLKYTFK